MFSEARRRESEGCTSASETEEGRQPSSLMTSPLAKPVPKTTDDEEAAKPDVAAAVEKESPTKEKGQGDTEIADKQSNVDATIEEIAGKLEQKMEAEKNKADTERDPAAESQDSSSATNVVVEQTQNDVDKSEEAAPTSDAAPASPEESQVSPQKNKRSPTKARRTPDVKRTPEKTGEVHEHRTRTSVQVAAGKSGGAKTTKMATPEKRSKDETSKAPKDVVEATPAKEEDSSSSVTQEVQVESSKSPVKTVEKEDEALSKEDQSPAVTSHLDASDVKEDVAEAKQTDRSTEQPKDVQPSPEKMDTETVSPVTAAADMAQEAAVVVKADVEEKATDQASSKEEQEARRSRPRSRSARSGSSSSIDSSRSPSSRGRSR